MPDHWPASAARERLGELIDAAAEGSPQFIRHRDGREAVLISLEQFRRINPPPGTPASPADDGADNTYSRARGLFGGPLHRPRRD